MAGEIVPRELPRAVAGFINRGKELDQIEAVCSVPASPGACHVVVIGGTAGVGKTALAVRWGHGASARFPDGQLYVNLRGFDDREPLAAVYALGSLLGRLGIAAAEIPVELEERAVLYQSKMAGSRRLVCLDNVLSAEQIRPLLPASEGCVVVVTTRGELAGLGRLEGAHTVKLDILPEPEAAELLRAVAGERKAVDDPADWTILARLCGLLPLALRIAGQRLAARPFTPVGDLVETLRDESARLDALGQDLGEAPVRAVFAWSYRDLPDTAAAVFRALGAHPGEYYTAHSAVVLAGVSAAEARAALETLVGANLLEQLDAHRFATHDLLRAYAIDLARTVDGDRSVQEATGRLAAWYLASVAAASAAMGCDSLGLAVGGEAPVGIRFVDYGPAREWFASERSNLPALVLAAARIGGHETAWRLAAALLGIYEVDNTFDDWFATSECGLDSARRCQNAYGEAVMLESLGKAYRQTHRFEDAERMQREALRIRKAIGDQTGAIRSVNDLGLIYRSTRRYDQARESFRSVADLARASGDLTWLAFGLMNLGGVEVETGSHSAARDALLEAVALLGETGLHIYEINALQDLGAAYRGLGELAAALETVGRAVDLARQLRNEVFLAEALLERARALTSTGEREKALADYAEVVSIQRSLTDSGREAVALDETGTAYMELDRPDEAVTHFEAALRIHRQLGDAQRAKLVGEHLAAAKAAAVRQEAEPGG